jgi:membrane protease YdiL (CAAX protease family)
MSLLTSQDQPPRVSLIRNTPADTWRWMRFDLVARVMPLLLGPLLLAWFFHLPLAELGLPTLSWEQVAQQIGLGLAIGLPFSAIAATYRALILPRFRLPTLSDHLVQSIYYLLLNAPAEELFYRGLVFTLVVRWSGSAALGWLVSSASYALYHRLGRWSWLSVAGVAVAGALFSTLYLLQPAPRSILLPVVVHGLTTCAFLNLGDVAAFLRAQRKRARALKT